MIKALIFDLDGTLLDTKEANYLSYNAAFKDIGVRIERSKYYQYYGLRFDDLLKFIAPNITNKQKYIIKEKKKSTMNKIRTL
jgi:beta-phosphoglucomutase